MKIALVHDDFIQAGGAESLFATIASLWPNAPIYTSLVDWNKLPASINRDRIKTSFIQKIPFAKNLYKLLLPLYPLAFEGFDFSNFDLVISSTTRFAKSIITKPKTLHICYINSTPRFLWNRQMQNEYLPQFISFLTKPLLVWLKRWDKAASFRADYYIANSENVKKQVQKHYNQDSQVVYPFADLDFFKIPKIHNWQLKSQNYYLVVSRLVKWKKIDIAIVAAKNLGLNLKIVGIGPDEGRLKKLAYDSQIEFLNCVNLETLRELYQNAKVLIITQVEDFGISAVEAQACGIPVIAYAKGGPAEIIVNGQLGILYGMQTSKSLQDAILTAGEVKWKILDCHRNAQRFSKSQFEQSLKKLINSNYRASKP